MPDRVDPIRSEEPPEEPSHPHDMDWDKERERQAREGAPYRESDEEREERERSILR